MNSTQSSCGSQSPHAPLSLNEPLPHSSSGSKSKSRRLIPLFCALLTFLCLMPVNLPVYAQSTQQEEIDALASSDWKSRGALGFFEYEDSTEAVNILLTHLNSIVQLNNPNDAVSWDYFRQSIEYVREANNLRKQNGLSELRITDFMMAISQVQADASAATLTHSRIYPVNENLAWGMTIGAPFGTQQHNNPFDYWYTDERDLYLSNPNVPYLDVAHYHNLMRSDFQITGFACNTRRTNNRTMFCQTFSTASWNESWTPDEYAARLDAYQQAMENPAPVKPSPAPAKPQPDTNPTPDAAEGQVPMYRLFNPNSTEHLYTANLYEYNYLSTIGWVPEGFCWMAAETGVPVYRLYNPNNGDHHYTTDLNEKNVLVSVGWTDEGIGWYAPEDGQSPVYRLYNPYAEAGYHHFTTDENERDVLAGLGWIYEGIAFNAY